MLTLMHGDYRTMTLDDLDKVPVTPRGERSDRWKGVQHGELVHSIVNAFGENGLKPINPHYYVSPNNAAVIGGFELANGSPQLIKNLPNKTHLAFGFIHSNDSQRALRFTMGGKVLICENGMVVGEFDLKRKHTTGLNLASWVNEGVERYLIESENVGEQAERLAGIDVGRATHDRGLVRLAREGAIPWRLLGHLDASWATSGDNAKDAFHARNAWSWMNHCTEVAKRIPVIRQYAHLHRIFQVSSRLAKR